jgi:hypothetical protein
MAIKPTPVIKAVLPTAPAPAMEVPAAAEVPARPRFVTVTDDAPEALAAAAAQIAPPEPEAIDEPKTSVPQVRQKLNAKTLAEQAAGREATAAYAPVEE